MRPSAKLSSAPSRVALLIETSNAYGRGLLAGVADYVQAHGPWSIYLPEAGRGDPLSARLRGWNGDGVLMRAEDRTAARVAAATGAHVVDLSVAGRLPGVPVVHSDVRAEATLGFEHLWERGFRNLAFCGVSDYRWATWQHEQFEALANQKGIRPVAYVAPLRSTQARGGTTDRRELVRWLKALPKPVGIFACHDLRGQQVLDACRAAGLRIPDDVAVLGVDDDAVRCSLSDPPLSSVAPDTRRVGFVGAEMLARLMAGKRVTAGTHFVAPLGVTARRSTDAIAVADPDVAAALRFIRDRCVEPIGVIDVLRQVPLSRRALEARFVRSVGRTPHGEIVRCRVERAVHLLKTTDLSVKAVAARVGAATPEYLSVIFRRVLGSPPSAFRRRTAGR